MEIDIKVPTVGESITEVTIAQWVKKDGDQVQQDEVLCEIESDKATFELNAEQPGILKILTKEGETVSIGSKIATIDTAGAAAKPAKDEAPKAEAEPEKASSDPKEEKERGDNAVGDAGQKNTYATGTPSPAAQKILDEKNIKPEAVKGTGRDGRITKNDATEAKDSQAILQNSPEKAATEKMETQEGNAPSSGQQNLQPGDRNTHRERMSALRKTIAKRLVEAKNQTAMLTTFNEVDMSAIMDVRKKYKDAFKEKYGIGLGFMSIFTRAVCEAIKEFPSVNAEIDGNELIYHDYVDVGIAVSTPRGLVVPVVRNAESMSFAEIEKSIMDLAVRARDNKIAIEEMTGGTFTITNGGVFGSLLSTPILNAPQSAILGMHNIVDRPIALNGQVVIRPMMYIALSYDHRVIDGRESVSFLLRVKQIVEDPYRLLLEV